MHEDDFLVEAASWAGYYDRAQTLIKEAMQAGVNEPPPQEVVDNPEAFGNWLEYCERVCR